MKDLVENIARALVDRPEEVRLNSSKGSGRPTPVSGDRPPKAKPEAWLPTESASKIVTLKPCRPKR